VRFDDKVVIVTGSSRGIGKAIAIAFAKEGAHLVLAARSVEESVPSNRPSAGERSTAEEIRTLGKRVLPVKTDVSSVSDTEELARKALQEFGRIDILVNNAAYTEMSLKPFYEYTPPEWDVQINTDFKGVLNCCSAVLPQMMRQQSGKIINITSGAARTGSPMFAIYGACKAAVANFTKSLSKELAFHGIEVTAVAPGIIRTEANLRAVGEDALNAILSASGVPRMGEPEEVASLVLFLASDEARYITGQQYQIDGGYNPP